MNPNEIKKGLLKNATPNIIKQTATSVTIQMPKYKTYNVVKNDLENWIKNFDGTAVEMATLSGAFLYINQLEIEISRLQKFLDDKCDRCIARDKSDAIKEFADKMKGVISEIDDTYIERIVEDYIDNSVKEMVGDEE